MVNTQVLDALIDTMSYAQRKNIYHYLQTKHLQQDKENVQAMINQHGSYVGKCYKDSDEKTFYFAVNEKASENDMDMIVFQPEIQILEQKRERLLFDPNSAFSTIQFAGPKMQTIPLFDASAKWLQTHQEITKEELVYYLNKFFNNLEYALTSGMFDTGKHFLENIPEIRTEGPGAPNLAEVVQKMAPEVQEALRIALGQRLEQDRYDQNILVIKDHQVFVGKCYKKQDKYYMLISARSVNDYWMEAITFSTPVNLKKKLLLHLMDSPAALYEKQELSTIHTASVPVFASFAKWQKDAEEITQETFIASLRDYQKQLIEIIEIFSA